MPDKSPPPLARARLAAHMARMTMRSALGTAVAALLSLAALAAAAFAA